VYVHTCICACIHTHTSKQSKNTPPLTSSNANCPSWDLTWSILPLLIAAVPGPSLGGRAWWASLHALRSGVGLGVGSGKLAGFKSAEEPGFFVFIFYLLLKIWAAFPFPTGHFTASLERGETWVLLLQSLWVFQL